MPADKLVKEIIHVIQTLNEHDIESLSGDTLSRLVVKLASYKAGLGEHVAEAKKLAWDAEADYNLAKAESYQSLRESGMNSTDSKETKSIGAHESFVRMNKSKYQAELISNLHKDCHDLIDGIKSRLIHLQAEAKESNAY